MLTGVFLEIGVISPDDKVETHERALLDRAGFAVRQNGGTVDFSGINAEQPAIDELEVITASIETSPPDINLFIAHLEYAGLLQDKARSLIERLRGGGPQPDLAREAANAIRSLLLVLTQGHAGSFGELSRATSAVLQHLSLVKSYIHSPRIVISSIRRASNSRQLQVQMYLRKNDVRTLAYPGQMPISVRAFNTVRGLMEEYFERLSLAALLGEEPDSPLIRPGVLQIVQSALKEGVPLAFISKETMRELDSLNVSAEALARISLAAEAGRVVIIPSRPVPIGNQALIGWYEHDPETGVTIDVSENGGHQAIPEETFLLYSIFDLVTRTISILGLLDLGFQLVTLINVLSFPERRRQLKAEIGIAAGSIDRGLGGIAKLLETLLAWIFHKP